LAVINGIADGGRISRLDITLAVLGTDGPLRTLAGYGANDAGGGSLLSGATRRVWGLAKLAGSLPVPAMFANRQK